MQAWADELGAECRIIDGYLYRDMTVALRKR
jgi:hypothetical protein